MISATKDTLQNALSNAFNSFINCFSTFDEMAINRIPFPGSWTPGQVAMHIILATDGVPDDKTAACNRDYDALLPMIRPWWEDLSQKYQSPEPLLPDSEQYVKVHLLAELQRVRKRDQAIVVDQDLTAICLSFELPGIGYLTRYEWLWFIEMHLRRHTFQLEKIMKVVSEM